MATSVVNTTPTYQYSPRELNQHQADASFIITTLLHHAFTQNYLYQLDYINTSYTPNESPEQRKLSQHKHYIELVSNPLLLPYPPHKISDLLASASNHSHKLHDTRFQLITRFKEALDAEKERRTTHSKTGDSKNPAVKNEFKDIEVFKIQVNVPKPPLKDSTVDFLRMNTLLPTPTSQFAAINANLSETIDPVKLKRGYSHDLNQVPKWKEDMAHIPSPSHGLTYAPYIISNYAFPFNFKHDSHDIPEQFKVSDEQIVGNKYSTYDQPLFESIFILQYAALTQQHPAIISTILSYQQRNSGNKVLAKVVMSVVRLIIIQYSSLYHTFRSVSSQFKSVLSKAILIYYTTCQYTEVFDFETKRQLISSFLAQQKGACLYDTLYIKGIGLNNINNMLLTFNKPLFSTIIHHYNEINMQARDGLNSRLKLSLFDDKHIELLQSPEQYNHITWLLLQYNRFYRKYPHITPSLISPVGGEFVHESQYFYLFGTYYTQVLKHAMFTSDNNLSRFESYTMQYYHNSQLLTHSPESTFNQYIFYEKSTPMTTESLRQLSLPYQTITNQYHSSQQNSVEHDNIHGYECSNTIYDMIASGFLFEPIINLDSAQMDILNLYQDHLPNSKFDRRLLTRKIKQFSTHLSSYVPILKLHHTYRYYLPTVVETSKLTMLTYVSQSISAIIRKYYPKVAVNPYIYDHYNPFATKYNYIKLTQELIQRAKKVSSIQGTSSVARKFMHLGEIPDLALADIEFNIKEVIRQEIAGANVRFCRDLKLLFDKVAAYKFLENNGTTNPSPIIVSLEPTKTLDIHSNRRREYTLATPNCSRSQSSISKDTSFFANTSLFTLHLNTFESNHRFSSSSGNSDKMNGSQSEAPSHHLNYYYNYEQSGAFYIFLAEDLIYSMLPSCVTVLAEQLFEFSDINSNEYFTQPLLTYNNLSKLPTLKDILSIVEPVVNTMIKTALATNSNDVYHIIPILYFLISQLPFDDPFIVMPYFRQYIPFKYHLDVSLQAFYSRFSNSLSSNVTSPSEDGPINNSHVTRLSTEDIRALMLSKVDNIVLFHNFNIQHNTFMIDDENEYFSSPKARSIMRIDPAKMKNVDMSLYAGDYYELGDILKQLVMFSTDYYCHPNLFINYEKRYQKYNAEYQKELNEVEFETNASGIDPLVFGNQDVPQQQQLNIIDRADILVYKGHSSVSFDDHLTRQTALKLFYDNFYPQFCKSSQPPHLIESFDSITPNLNFSAGGLLASYILKQNIDSRDFLLAIIEYSFAVTNELNTLISFGAAPPLNYGQLKDSIAEGLNYFIQSKDPEFLPSGSNDRYFGYQTLIINELIKRQYDPTIVRYFVNLHGLQWNTIDSLGLTPLHYCFIYHYDAHVVENEPIGYNGTLSEDNFTITILNFVNTNSVLFYKLLQKCRMFEKFFEEILFAKYIKKDTPEYKEYLSTNKLNAIVSLDYAHEVADQSIQKGIQQHFILLSIIHTYLTYLPNDKPISRDLLFRLATKYMFDHDPQNIDEYTTVIIPQTEVHSIFPYEITDTQEEKYIPSSCSTTEIQSCVQYYDYYCEQGLLSNYKISSLYHLITGSPLENTVPISPSTHVNHNMNIITYPYLVFLLQHHPDNLLFLYSNQVLFYDMICVFLDNYLVTHKSCDDKILPPSDPSQLEHMKYHNIYTNKFLKLTQYDFIFIIYLLISINYAPKLLADLLKQYFNVNYIQYLYKFYNPSQQIPITLSIEIQNYYNISHYTSDNNTITGTLYTQPYFHINKNTTAQNVNLHQHITGANVTNPLQNASLSRYDQYIDLFKQIRSKTPDNIIPRHILKNLSLSDRNYNNTLTDFYTNSNNPYNTQHKIHNFTQLAIFHILYLVECLDNILKLSLSQYLQVNFEEEVLFNRKAPQEMKTPPETTLTYILYHTKDQLLKTMHPVPLDMTQWFIDQPDIKQYFSPVKINLQDPESCREQFMNDIDFETMVLGKLDPIKQEIWKHMKHYNAYCIAQSELFSNQNFAKPQLSEQIITTQPIFSSTDTLIDLSPSILDLCIQSTNYITYTYLLYTFTKQILDQEHENNSSINFTSVKSLLSTYTKLSPSLYTVGTSHLIDLTASFKTDYTTYQTLYANDIQNLLDFDDIYQPNDSGRATHRPILASLHEKLKQNTTSKLSSFYEPQSDDRCFSYNTNIPIIINFEVDDSLLVNIPKDLFGNKGSDAMQLQSTFNTFINFIETMTTHANTYHNLNTTALYENAMNIVSDIGYSFPSLLLALHYHNQLPIQLFFLAYEQSTVKTPESILHIPVNPNLPYPFPFTQCTTFMYTLSSTNNTNSPLFLTQRHQIPKSKLSPLRYASNNISIQNAQESERNGLLPPDSNLYDFFLNRVYHQNTHTSLDPALALPPIVQHKSSFTSPHLSLFHIMLIETVYQLHPFDMLSQKYDRDIQQALKMDQTSDLSIKTNLIEQFISKYYPYMFQHRLPNSMKYDHLECNQFKDGTISVRQNVFFPSRIHREMYDNLTFGLETTEYPNVKKWSDQHAEMVDAQRLKELLSHPLSDSYVRDLRGKQVGYSLALDRVLPVNTVLYKYQFNPKYVFENGPQPFCPENPDFERKQREKVPNISRATFLKLQKEGLEKLHPDQRQHLNEYIRPYKMPYFSPEISHDALLLKQYIFDHHFNNILMPFVTKYAPDLNQLIPTTNQFYAYQRSLPNEFLYYFDDDSERTAAFESWFTLSPNANLHGLKKFHVKFETIFNHLYSPPKLIQQTEIINNNIVQLDGMNTETVSYDHDPHDNSPEEPSQQPFGGILAAVRSFFHRKKTQSTDDSPENNDDHSDTVHSDTVVPTTLQPFNKISVKNLIENNTISSKPPMHSQSSPYSGTDKGYYEHQTNKYSSRYSYTGDFYGDDSVTDIAHFVKNRYQAKQTKFEMADIDFIPTIHPLLLLTQIRCIGDYQPIKFHHYNHDIHKKNQWLDKNYDKNIFTNDDLLQKLIPFLASQGFQFQYSIDFTPLAKYFQETQTHKLKKLNETNRSIDTFNNLKLLKQQYYIYMSFYALTINSNDEMPLSTINNTLLHDLHSERLQLDELTVATNNILVIYNIFSLLAVRGESINNLLKLHNIITTYNVNTVHISIPSPNNGMFHSFKNRIAFFIKSANGAIKLVENKESSVNIFDETDPKQLIDEVYPQREGIVLDFIYNKHRSSTLITLNQCKALLQMISPSNDLVYHFYCHDCDL